MRQSGRRSGRAGNLGPRDQSSNSKASSKSVLPFASHKGPLSWLARTPSSILQAGHRCCSAEKNLLAVPESVWAELRLLTQHLVLRTLLVAFPPGVSHCCLPQRGTWQTGRGAIALERQEGGSVSPVLWGAAPEIQALSLASVGALLTLGVLRLRLRGSPFLGCDSA